MCTTTLNSNTMAMTSFGHDHAASLFNSTASNSASDAISHASTATMHSSNHSQESSDHNQPNKPSTVTKRTPGHDSEPAMRRCMSLPVTGQSSPSGSGAGCPVACWQEQLGAMTLPDGMHPARQRLVLVTFATGEVGQAVCRQLLRAGFRVRAATVNPRTEAAKHLAEAGCEVVPVRFDRRDADGSLKPNAHPLSKAFEGIELMVHCVNFICTNADATIAWMRTIRGLPSHNIKFIVRVSSPVESAQSEVFDSWHSKASEAVSTTGIPWSDLRSTFVIQPWLKMVAPALRMMKRNPWGGLRGSWVDAYDVGLAAVCMLLMCQAGRVMVLRGVMSLSHCRATDVLPELVSTNTIMGLRSQLGNCEYVPSGTTVQFISQLITVNRVNPWDWAATDGGEFEALTGCKLNDLSSNWREEVCADTAEISSPL